MKMGKGLCLAVLMGCCVAGDAMASRHSLRSVKNFLVEHSSSFKQWGVSIIAACSLMATGCDPVLTENPAANYQHSSDVLLEEITAELEEGGRIAVVRLVDQDKLSLEIYDESVPLGLLEDKLVISNSELPLEIVVPSRQYNREDEMAALAVVWFALMGYAVTVTGLSVVLEKVFNEEMGKVTIVVGLMFSPALFLVTPYLMTRVLL